MKKIIFLLIIAVVLVGFMSAMETAHPPWNTVLMAEMSAFGIDNYAVTADTVSVAAQFVLPEGFLFVNYELFTNSGYFSLIKPVNTGQRLDYFNETEYWLLL
jgi:hypothetical protein